MKEVFITIGDGYVCWVGAGQNGSEPCLESESLHGAIGRVIFHLTNVANSIGEEWSFRFTDNTIKGSQ